MSDKKFFPERLSMCAAQYFEVIAYDLSRRITVALLRQIISSNVQKIFGTREQMNHESISCWNKMEKDGDAVILVGDADMGKADEAEDILH